MRTRPGFFDRSHVWAPSIVERDGVYYMFYTGVSDSAGVDSSYQRLGLATSVDLVHWNRLDQPIFDFTQVPWATGDSTNAAPFRDPFVMQDPTTSGRWLMAYSTAPASDPGGMIVGLASSDGDFAAWQDLQPLWITQRAYTFNDQVESPHLFEHDGLWYLFFTTGSGQPITFATAADPLGPLAYWTYRGRLGTMIGTNSLGWFASEYFRDGLVEYFAYVNGDRVEINRILWTTGWQFTLAQPELFHVQMAYWITPAVREGQNADLYIQAAWWAGRNAEFDCFWLDDDDVWHPVSNEVLGIPDQIPLSDDLTHWSWIARSLPDSLGAPEQPRIVLRLKDQTATTNLLQILPRLGNQDPGLGPPNPVDDPPAIPYSGGGADPVDTPFHPKLRTLRESMYGSQPAVLVEMPESQAARLDVFDLQGRRVRRVADRMLPKGATVMAWDGHDEAGARLPRGIYFARLTTPSTVLTTRILLR
jgi:hypothetical protein